MFLVFAIVALLLGSPGWAIFWILLYLLFRK